MNVLVLNCGCGDTPWGDVRLDLYRSPSTNVIGDLGGGLPFRTETFDEVLCLNVLEHVGNPFALLAEIARILKPGGLLRLRTDNASYWRFHIPRGIAGGLGAKMVGIHSGRYEEEDARGPYDRHYALFTLHHLKNHIEQAGLTVEWLDYWPREARPTLLIRAMPFLRPLVSSFLNVEAAKPA